jgi:membrane protein implicated in regulation of membrane protease activity
VSDILEVYWGCLITGIIFTLITVIFDDYLGNFLDGIMDALTIDLPGIFQTTVMMSALTVFGGAGILLTTYTGMPWLLILLLSLVIALILSVIFYFLYVRPMENTENSTGFSVQDFVGMVGEVTIPIPQNGYGEVVLTIAGSSSNQIASSFEGEEIELGKKVLVIDISEGTIQVSPYEQL